MPKILFKPSNIQVDVKKGTSVLKSALENGIELNHSCGGNGTCTTCRVVVESDLSLLPKRNELEIDTIEGRGFLSKERLACQLPVYNGLVVRIPTS